jgi:hypothetical protein
VPWEQAPAPRAWAPRSASAEAAGALPGAGRGAAVRLAGRPAAVGEPPEAAQAREQGPQASGARWAAQAAARARGLDGPDAERAQAPEQVAAADGVAPCSGRQTEPGSGRRHIYREVNPGHSADRTMSSQRRRSLILTYQRRRPKPRVPMQRACGTSYRRRRFRSPDRTIYRTSSVSAGSRNVRRLLTSIWRRFIAGVAILVLQPMAVCVSANPCSRGRVDSRGRGY